ncbi:MAG: hypothetical protein CL751_02505 [Chloroflexi bacterium]|nr:hypothetical protein [Chloroflexota bacterium]
MDADIPAGKVYKNKGLIEPSISTYDFADFSLVWEFGYLTNDSDVYQTVICESSVAQAESGPPSCTYTSFNSYGTGTPTPSPTPEPTPTATPDPYVSTKPFETSLVFEIDINPTLEIYDSSTVIGYSTSLINNQNKPISSNSVKMYNHENKLTGIDLDTIDLQHWPGGKYLLSGGSISSYGNVSPNVSTDDFSKWYLVWEFETIPNNSTEVVQKITCQGSWDKETTCNHGGPYLD